MDMFDEELAGMVSYTDDTAPAEMPVMECKAKAAPKPAPKKSEPVDAQYVPYPKKERDFMDRLRSCATYGGVCGAISMLMWWFEVNGLMAMEAAYPCILACGIIGAFGVGINFKK